ncbi:MAG: hypothetical protein CVT89_00475 [Candidatus Altiarchaeales archaeon HGW-Altiarchaeales-2]|nr:MAG: hypothetical protein CVT89_00475 [Candidatus Altiarchaeales archaeon HGW-Altiarchaeales-2]
MKKISDCIAEKTSGELCQSFKYCLDEVEVSTVEYEDKQEFSTLEIGETDSGLIESKSLEEYARDIQKNNPLFKYFLDGSRRTYKIEDIIWGNKIYPIIGGQIGVACCKRESDNFKKEVLENDIVLSLPNVANADGHNSDFYFNELVNEINKIDYLKIHNLKVSKILPYFPEQQDEVKYKNLGIEKIQDEMIEREKKIVSELASKNLLNQSNYLLKDGSLEYKIMKTGDYKEISKIKSNYKCVVGASKSFNPHIYKDKKGKSNAVKLSKLGLYHRTPVFKYYVEMSHTYFGVWYLRIRKPEHADSPFSGILKLEKILVSDKEREDGLSSDEVNMISGNIINERNPVCYGKDSRWANHLYPIYLTENFIKSQYLSNLHFINLF